MPRVNIYLSKEDYVLWEQLDNRSKFVSEVLNIRLGVSSVPSEPERPTMIVSASDVPMTPKNPSQLKSVEVCKIHGTPLTQFGKCMQKGCKNG